MRLSYVRDVLEGNNSACKTIRRGAIQVKMYDDILKALSNICRISKIDEYALLNQVGEGIQVLKLDVALIISRCALVNMKGKHPKSLFI